VFEDVRVHDCADMGVGLHEQCEDNRFVRLATHGNANHGFFTLSDGQRLNQVTAANNAGSGISLLGAGHVVLGARTFGNANSGLLLEASRTTVAGVVSFANGGTGVYVGAAGENTLLHVTTVDNGGLGYHEADAWSQTVVGLLAVNNANDGLAVTSSLAAPSNDLLVNLAASDNAGAGLHLESASAAVTLMGPVVLGPNSGAPCLVGGGALGVSDGTCTTSGAEGSTDFGGNSASSAVLRVNAQSAVGSFVGPLYVDEPANDSDTLGAASFTALNWVSFASFYRGWGRDSDSPYPHASHRSRCTGTCRIRDVSLSASDTLFTNRSGDGRNDNEPFTPGATCPSAAHGNRAVTDRRSSSNTFLTSAVEDVTDGVGDDDGLCESEERCLYAPNFGAHQGDRAALEAGPCLFEDGLVSGVSLYRMDSSP
jgi:hypothetical protein